MLVGVLALSWFSLLTPSKAQDLVLPGGGGRGTNISYSTNFTVIGSNTVAAGAGITVATNSTSSNIVYTISGSSPLSVAVGASVYSLSVTQANFVAGNNIVLLATNSPSGRVSVGINLASNLTFTTDTATMILGHFGARFGLSNATLGAMVWWVEDPSTDTEVQIGGNVVVAGTLYATNVHLTAIPGSGTVAGIDASGELFRTTVASVAGGTISNANTLYVDLGGNDSTAIRGRPDLPYLRPFAAKTAAVNGDTIIVNPGVYQNCTNLFKGGINWIGYGATLCHTNRTNDTGIGIFDDRFTGAITSSVKGFSFRYSTGYETTNSFYVPANPPTNTLGCVVITNARSQVTFEFDTIDYQDVRSSAEFAGAIWLGGGTNCFIKGNLIRDVNLTTNFSIGFDPDQSIDVLVESFAIGIYWTSGEHHVDVKRVLCKYNSFYAGGGNTLPGNCWVTGDYFMGQFYVAGSASQSNWRVWATVKEVETTPTNNNSAGAIIFGFGGKLYFNAEKVTETGTESSPNGGIGINMLTGSSTCEGWFNIQKLSAGSQWINLQSGTLDANIMHFEDLGTVNKGISVTGGKLKLAGGRANVTNATGSVFYHGAGDAHIHGMRLTATNSSQSPVILGTNGAILANCTLVSKSTVFSLFSTNAQSANIQGCWGRTPETNVSYQVGPWTVDSNTQ